MTRLHELLTSVQARVGEEIGQRTTVLHAIQTLMNWCMTHEQAAPRTVSAITRPLPYPTQIQMVLTVLEHATRSFSNEDIRRAVADRYGSWLSGKQISEVLKSKRVRDSVVKQGDRRNGFTYRMRPSEEPSASVELANDTASAGPHEEQAA